MRPGLPTNRTALIAGASGLTGSHLLNFILKDEIYSKVKIIVRKELNVRSDKLEQHVVDFDKLAELKDVLKADDVFCCLGTTIKKAGSQQTFKKIDYNYPVELAKVSLQSGAKQFLIITAIGADPSSRVFYNRVKGEVEDEIMKLNFYSINIFRPSLILGERNEARPFEKAGEFFFKIFSFLFIKKLKKYRAIHASDIARAMLITAKEFHQGIDVIESDRIKAIADMRM